MLVYDYLEAVRQAKETSSVEFWIAEISHIVAGKRDATIHKFGMSNDYMRSLINYSPNYELSEYNLKIALKLFLKIYDFEGRIRMENYSSCLNLIEIVGDFHSNDADILDKIVTFLDTLVNKFPLSKSVHEIKEISLFLMRLGGEIICNNTSLQGQHEVDFIRMMDNNSPLRIACNRYVSLLIPMLDMESHQRATAINYLIKLDQQKSEYYSKIAVNDRFVYNVIINELCSSNGTLVYFENFVRTIFSISNDIPERVDYFFRFLKRMNCLVLFQEETDNTFKFYLENRQERKLFFIVEFDAYDILINYGMVFGKITYDKNELTPIELSKESEELKNFVDNLPF